MHFHLPLLALFFAGALAAPTGDAVEVLEARGDPSPGPKPDPKTIYIKDFTYGGSGCRAGTVSNSSSSDLTRITFVFDDYVAQSGKDIEPSEYRKACQLGLKLHIPHGWQYSIFQADHRGFRDVTKGSKAFWRASYYFTGSSQTASTTKRFDGPSYGDFTETNVFGVKTLVWSECGGESLLNVKTALNIQPLGTHKPNLIQMDSTDVKFVQKLYFSWRRCKK